MLANTVLGQHIAPKAHFSHARVETQMACPGRVLRMLRAATRHLSRANTTWTIFAPVRRSDPQQPSSGSRRDGAFVFCRLVVSRLEGTGP